MISFAQLIKPGKEHDHQVAFFAYCTIAYWLGFGVADLWVNGFSDITIDRHTKPLELSLKWIHAIPNGGERNIVSAAMMKAEGVKRGIPDIFLPVPTTRFAGLYIEMKTAQKRNLGLKACSDEQLEFRLHAVQHNYMWVLCFGVNEAINCLKLYYEDIEW